MEVYERVSLQCGHAHSSVSRNLKGGMSRSTVSERVIDFRVQKSMPPDDHVLTEHAQ